MPFVTHGPRYLGCLLSDLSPGIAPTPLFHLDCGRDIKLTCNDIYPSTMELFKGPQHLYRPLRGSEIRVVKFQPFHPALENRDRIVANLSYISLDNSADFLALSYVWGNMNQTRTISLNGQDFPVTDNLYWALFCLRNCYCRDRKPYDSNLYPCKVDWNGQSEDVKIDYAQYWWIDAICINQRDVVERSRQVPRMKDLYSMAIRVIIWLGAYDADSDLLLDKLVKVAEIYHKAITEIPAPAKGEDIPIEASVRLLKEVSPNLGELIKPLRILLSDSTYFTRIWTVQEAVIARKDPAVMIGQHTTSIRKLELLRSGLNAAVKGGGYDEYLGRGDFIVLRFTYMQEIMNWSSRLSKSEEHVDSGGQLPGKLDRLIIQARRIKSWPWKKKLAKEIAKTEIDQFALELYDVLSAFSYRSATNPYDRIYGLLGLTSLPVLPNHLQPDYSCSFEEVCFNYSKFLIQRTGYLDTFSAGVNRLEQGPSWVSDFSTAPRGERPATTNKVAFSENGQCMTVTGVVLGVVVGVHYDDALRTIDPTTMPSKDDILSAWWDLVNSILQPSARIRSLDLRTVVEEWAIPAFEGGFGGDKEKLLLILEEITSADGLGTKPVVWSENALECAAQLSFLFQLSSFFLLDNGTVCHWHHVKRNERQIIGEYVCALRGTTCRTILKPRIGMDGFIVQGPCWTFPVTDVKHTEAWFDTQIEMSFNLY